MDFWLNEEQSLLLMLLCSSTAQQADRIEHLLKGHTLGKTYW